MISNGATLDPSHYATHIGHLLVRRDKIAAADLCLVMQHCIRGGMDLEAELDRNGDTMLLLAARKVNSASVTELLLDSGARLYHRNKAGFDAFIYASLHGNIETFAGLLKEVKKRGDKHWSQYVTLDNLHDVSKIQKAGELFQFHLYYRYVFVIQ